MIPLAAATPPANPYSSVISVFKNYPAGAREFLASCRTLIDAELDRLIPKESQSPERIHRAIRWSVLGGGKRFRPALLMAVGETFGAPQDQLLRTACALEMIHTYSLIHDDLPSMDDDQLRRGRATCHIEFDEATAILAGDALQTLAFQTVAEDEKLAPAMRVELIAEIARASGVPAGMVAGQALDLEAETRSVQGEELERIHGEKTGALVRASARAGALIAGVMDHELNEITDYATNLGLLFQITDDLLDLTATAEELGKTPGKDARSRKATFPSVYGIDVTRQRISAVHQASCDALDRINRPTQLLSAIADFILSRDA
jgi:geranylgeranyl pyrophosphate synthase